MTSIKTEIIAGVTTFFTMAYIIVVNPAILSTDGTGMPFSGVMTATVMICFLMTLLMGLYARLPFAVAPGMGINAFFTYTIILSEQVPWPTALGAVFWSGVLFLAISATPLREMIARAIPLTLRSAIAAGIGIFLTFIGLRSCGFIAADPVTFVRLGHMDETILAALIGGLIMVWMLRRKNPFAFLAGMILITTAALACGWNAAPRTIVSLPDFRSVFLQLDIWGALKISLLPVMFSLVFTDLFDSISTFIGVSQACDLLDEKGQPRNLRQGLIVDSFATLFAGLFGTSPGTTYIESSAGIEAGGRTGLTSVVTALCFLPCLFLAPLAGAVPAIATAPVLVIVGAVMFRSITNIPLRRLEDVLPAFLTMVLIPLTFSITQGILWGFIAHVALYVVSGRHRDVPVMMYALAVISVALLLI
jgi:adenine/guanine/hypoxanthine permease